MNNGFNAENNPAPESGAGNILVEDNAVLHILGGHLDFLEKEGKALGKLLDIGAKSGQFLQMAEARGFKVSGVETNNELANIGRNNGLDIRTGTLADLPKVESFYDVITIFNFAKILRDPQNDLKQISKMLTDDGFMIVTTNNQKHGNQSTAEYTNMLESLGLQIAKSGPIVHRHSISSFFEHLNTKLHLSLLRSVSHFFKNHSSIDLALSLGEPSGYFLIGKK